MDAPHVNLQRALGCALALALAGAAAPVLAAGKAEARLPMSNTGQRFAIAGSLAPVAAPEARGGAYALRAALHSSASEIPVQEGGGLALMARLAVSPMVCYGDTIFRDGFNTTWP